MLFYVIIKLIIDKVVKQMYKLGIDIGTSHIGLGIFDTKKKKLIKKKYIPTKRYNKCIRTFFKQFITKKYIKFLITKIDSFITDYKIEYIGIGCPGGVDTEKSIFYGTKYLGVGKINFNKELNKYNCPIYIDNDCNCAAVGEAINSEYRNFLMITIGTGVGFSLIKKDKNKVRLAKDDEILKILKLNKIPNTKKSKYIESFKNLAKSYNERLPRDAIFNDIKNTRIIVEKYINNFVTGINIINKEIKIKNICIGGSFSLHKRYYLRKMQERLPKHQIFVAKNYNDSGIIGAINLPIKRY